MRLATVRLRFSRGRVIDATLVVVANPCTVVRHVDLRVSLPNRLGANGNERVASGKAEKGVSGKGAEPFIRIYFACFRHGFQ